MPSQIRRKFDKTHIDSVSVMAALLEALLSEAVIAHPLDVEVDVWGEGEIYTLEFTLLHGGLLGASF